MKQRPRIYYTEGQKALMWERWRKGESLQKIAQLFDRNHSSIHQILVETGGIRPTQRCRSKLALTLAEREQISRSVVAGPRSVRSQPHWGGRHSSISREIKRNGDHDSYRATQADQAAWDRARRPKNCRLVQNQALAHLVAGKLQLQWSPAQIAGWLKRTYPGDENYQVSHETIFQARGALKKELLEPLRRTRVMRRSRHHTQKTPDHGRITGTVSISERPATVEDRAVPGHWEGDLLCGSANSQIATLVERHTRYVMRVKVASKDTQTVINALIKNARKLPQELYQTLTWDRGPEMADHRRFTLATDIQVYFCDPHNPWQRGSNENTNGLLRQYFPKGTDLSEYSQTKLNAVARRLNERPRKTTMKHPRNDFTNLLRRSVESAGRSPSIDRYPPGARRSPQSLANGRCQAGWIRARTGCCWAPTDNVIGGRGSCSGHARRRIPVARLLAPTREAVAEVETTLDGGFNCDISKEQTMAKYLIEASYTAEGLRGLQKDKASGRKQAVTKVVESLEGKVEAVYFALGEHDVVIIAELPDVVSVAALSLGVSATGLVRTKTTALLSVEETDRALAKKLNYRGPGA